jgi:sirohydrochlorin ferrochelatase
VNRAILLVDHGSRRAEANAQLDALADRVRARRPGCFVAVAHLEIAEPSVAQGIDACVAAGATEVSVVPYFLAPGRHSREDIPGHVDDARARHPGVAFRIAEPLGLHDRVVEALLDRADAAG